MRTTNPVLTRLGADAARERVGGPQPEVFGAGAGQSVIQTDADTRPMTVDDVVVRTIALIGLTVLSAAATWALLPPESAIGLAFPAAMVGLVLGLVIAFARVTNPLIIGAYAVVEGVFVGGLSLFLVQLTGQPGIVMQAVIATMGVFLLMAFLYKSGRIRATPKFRRGMIAALIGCAGVIMINLVLALFGIDTGLRGGGPLAIIASLVFIVVAALSFILSFHEVEEGVRMGVPQKYAWAFSFGILVSLIWLYIEIIRLISYFTGSD